MRVALIVNPVAGGHAGSPRHLPARVAEAASLLERCGASVRVAMTERGGHATRLAAEAVASGVDVVAAWGGDGTVNEVAAALAGSPAVLAIVPAGSGSGLARALGVPLSWRNAVALAAGGDTRRIDLGRLDGRVFANVAGVGFDACVARAFNADREASPGRRGLLAYGRLTVGEVFRYRPLTCRVFVGGERIEGPMLLVALANSSQYGNGARVAPDARLDDGQIDVVAVRATSPVRDLLRARRLFTGSVARDPAAAIRRAARVRLEADVPLSFHTDGEPHDGGTTIEAEVLPGALLVRVPRGRSPLKG